MMNDADFGCALLDRDVRPLAQIAQEEVRIRCKYPTQAERMVREVLDGEAASAVAVELFSDVCKRFGVEDQLSLCPGRCDRRTRVLRLKTRCLIADGEWSPAESKIAAGPSD